MTRWLIAVATVIAIGVATPARGDDLTGTGTALADYDPASKAWNGMSTFVRLAAGLGFEVIPVQSLEWGDLDEQDILVLVYPVQRVDPSNLSAFIAAGGHAIVADDFGDSGAALSRMGFLRAQVQTVETGRYYQSRTFAPIAIPMGGGHPISRGVTEVVTNHPAILTEVTGATPVIGFADGSAVVVAGERGTGRFAVVSDPSIFINRMLQFPGNLNLTVNLLRWMDRGGRARRVILLRGDVPMYGEPRSFIDDANMSAASRRVHGVNRWLEARNEWLLTPMAMRVVGAIVALALAALALLAMPPWRRKVMDGRWLGPPPRERRDLAARVVGDCDDGATNLIIPATVLRDSVNVALSRTVDHVDPIYQLPSRDLIARVSERHGADAAAVVARLHPRLRALPTRIHAAAAWSRSRVTRAELTDLFADAAALYRHLGEPPLEPLGLDRTTEA